MINVDEDEMTPFGSFISKEPDNTKKHDDYVLLAPNMQQLFPTPIGDVLSSEIYRTQRDSESGWALGSYETFAEKLKEAREDLQRAQSKATDLLLEIDNLMAHFHPTNNPQVMTPSEENLKTLIEHGFQKLEASIATIKEANQKASTCVCDKVNLKRAKPNEEHVKDGISGEGS